MKINIICNAAWIQNDKETEVEQRPQIEIKGLYNKSELVLTVQYENAACAGGLTFLTEATDIKITQI